MKRLDLRESNTSRVWRLVPDKDEIKVKSFDGTWTYLRQPCRTCHEVKLLNCFYFRSEQNRRNACSIFQKVETECCDCWDRRSKMNRMDYLNSTTIYSGATLTDFFI